MRVGIYQSALAGLDPEARLERLEARIDGAGLDLVVCPELFLSGYHAGPDLARHAEPRGGPLTVRAGRLAARHRTALVLGYPERDGDRLYNAAVALGPDGAELAHHRKRFPSPHSFEETTFAPGGPPVLFALHGLTCAILICYEIELLELPRAAALAGAEVLIAPTALVDAWPEVAARMVPTRAFENGAWLIYANHAGAEGGHRYLGGSRIVAPDGTEAAVAGADETLIAATLDTDAAARARARLPYLRDARTALERSP